MACTTIPTRLSLLSGACLGLLCISEAQAITADERFILLNQSMQNCIAAASRPGFPYYDRPEATRACQYTKRLLSSFRQEANKNRNLACSSRIAELDFDLWMIQFVGGERMKPKTNQALLQVSRNCFNMDSR